MPKVQKTDRGVGANGRAIASSAIRDFTDLLAIREFITPKQWVASVYSVCCLADYSNNWIGTFYLRYEMVTITVRNNDDIQHSGGDFLVN